MEAKRDENRKTVGLGWDGTTTQPIKVDPVTERLLISVDIVSDTTPTLNSRKIDQNHIPVSAGVNATNSSVMPFLVDNRNDNLWVDLLQE